MRLPRASILQHLAGLIARVTGRMDPHELARYEEATRIAFEAAVKGATGAGATLQGLSPRRPGQTQKRFPPLIQSHEAPPVVSGSEQTAPIVQPTASTPARDPTVDQPERQKRPLTSDAGADVPVRTPSNVARVADDFFDGLIGRVEGHR